MSYCQDGYTALHLACIYGLQKCIECLIQAEVNVNLKDKVIVPVKLSL